MNQTDIDTVTNLIELRNKYQDKEDKFYRIGRRCNDIGSTLAFCTVGAVIADALKEPNNKELVENIMIYSSFAAGCMLLVSLVLCGMMTYYMHKVDKIDDKFKLL